MVQELLESIAVERIGKIGRVQQMADLLGRFVGSVSHR
jgi:hypothetical protein